MNDKYALRAGLFIIFSIVLAVGVLVSIAGSKSLFRKMSTYTVVFEPGDNVSGLGRDSEVRIYGVKVGSVQKVEVVPDEHTGAKVLVDFTIPDSFTLHDGVMVYSDASFTGTAWLNIESFGEGDLIGEHELIEGQTAGLSALLPMLRELLPKANTTLTKFTETGEEFKGLASDIREKLPGIVDKYNQLTDAGKEVMTEAKAVMVRAQESLAKLDPTLDNVEKISADMRSLIVQNRAKIDRTMTALRRAAENLDGGVADIRRAPWRLVYKPDKKDQQNLEVYAAAREFADAAEDLESAAAAFRDAANDPQSDPEQIEKMRQDLIDKFNDFERIQTEIWAQFES